MIHKINICEFKKKMLENNCLVNEIINNNGIAMTANLNVFLKANQKVLEPTNCSTVFTSMLKRLNING